MGRKTCPECLEAAEGAKLVLLLPVYSAETCPRFNRSAKLRIGPVLHAALVLAPCLQLCTCGDWRLLRWGLKLQTHALQLRAATSALSQCPRCSWMCPKRCTSTVRSDPPRLEDIRGIKRLRGYTMGSLQQSTECSRKVKKRSSRPSSRMSQSQYTSPSASLNCRLKHAIMAPRPAKEKSRPS